MSAIEGKADINRTITSSARPFKIGAREPDLK
jgi:hypothetical protein